jgi:hypothetical protein
MSEEWSYNDIPITDWTVLTEPNPADGTIRQVTRVAARTQEKLIQTQSDQVRNALIDMGWTPPAGTEIPRPVLAGMYVERAADLSDVILVRGKKLSELCRADLMVMAVEWCMESIERGEREGAERERTDDPQADHAQVQPRREPAVPK